jgi:hypothetical protein
MMPAIQEMHTALVDRQMMQFAKGRLKSVRPVIGCHGSVPRVKNESNDSRAWQPASAADPGDLTVGRLLRERALHSEATACRAAVA